MYIFNEDLEKDDIEPLDTILNYCAEHNCFMLSHLRSVLKLEGTNEDLQSTIECYATFLSNYNVANVAYNGLGQCFIKKNKNTANFIAYGGFERVYKKQEQKRKDEERNRQLTAKQIQDIKDNKARAKQSFWIAILSGLIALGSLIVSIISITNTK